MYVSRAIDLRFIFHKLFFFLTNWKDANPDTHINPGNSPVTLSFKAEIFRKTTCVFASLHPFHKTMATTAEATFPIPVTLLSGFLGSGKTTLLKHILEGNHGLRIAVIINDIAAVNIDAKLVNNKDFNISQLREKVVQLENGCACCTLRSDLIGQLVNLANLGKYQYILIEGSGLSEPMSIAQTFTERFSAQLLGTYTNQMELLKSGEVTVEELFGDNVDTKEAYNIILQVLKLGGVHKFSKLDTAVTVIDAFNFLSNYESFELATTSEATALADSAAAAEETEGAEPAEADSSITDLLIQQIEFADVVVLNKIAEVKDAKVLEKVISIITTLNPKAKLYQTNYCDISLDKVLNTGLFSFDRIAKMPSWATSLENVELNGAENQKKGDNHHHDHDHDHDHHHHDGEACCSSEEDNHIKKYGINSFIYKSNRPLHPGKLNRLLRDKFMLIKLGEEEDSDEEADSEEEVEEEEAGRKRVKDSTTKNARQSKKIKSEKDLLDHDFSRLTHKELIANKQNSVFGNVIRLKGFLWLASSVLSKCELGGSGQLIKFQPSSQWLNKFTLPFLTRMVDAYDDSDEEEQQQDENGEIKEKKRKKAEISKETFAELLKQIEFDENDIQRIIDTDFSDASNEIVFIGFNLNKQEISKAMDECLLTDEEWQFFRYTLYDKVGFFKSEKEQKLKEIGKPKNYEKELKEQGLFDVVEGEEPDILQVEDFFYAKFGDGYVSFI